VPNASSVSRAKSCSLLWGVLTMLHLYETKGCSVLSRRLLAERSRGCRERNRAWTAPSASAQRFLASPVEAARQAGCNTDQWHGKKNPRCGIVYTNAL